MTKDEWISALLGVGFKQREDGVLERLGVEIEHTPDPCSCADDADGYGQCCCPHGEWSASVGGAPFIGSNTPIDALRVAIADAAQNLRYAERVLIEDFSKIGVHIITLHGVEGSPIRVDAERVEHAYVTEHRWGKRKPGVGGTLTNAYGTTLTPFGAHDWSVLVRETPDEIWAKVMATTAP